jgi:hypothetical protein
MHNPTLLPSLLSTTRLKVPQSVLEACLVSVPVFAGQGRNRLHLCKRSDCYV